MPEDKVEVASLLAVAVEALEEKLEIRPFILDGDLPSPEEMEGVNTFLEAKNGDLIEVTVAIKRAE